MKIALLGYGKMGKAIEEIILADGTHLIEGRYSIENVAELTAENLKKADVAIEFTVADAAINNLKLCAVAGIPTVCGSTGWYAAFDEISTLFKKQNTGLVYATNFSVGANLFFELNKKLAERMKDFKDYKVRLEETHHTQKKDSPSGTAITLMEGITAVHPQKEIPHISHRIDPVVGTHTIYYDCEIDTISITHQAHSRKGFAQGAVIAAEWIAGKTGVHSFASVLGLQS